MSRSAMQRSALSVIAVLLAGNIASAQQASPLMPVTSGLGTVVVPKSSLPVANGAGEFAHTNSRRFLPTTPVTPADYGTFYETPASLACVYREGPMPYGCIPGQVTTLATGGSKMIAIVDAYHDPNITSDLAVYSKQYGLPRANFQVVYATGSQPATDPTGGWEAEEAIDVEMAHALAPYAKIILVEAASPSYKDLLLAVDVASARVAQAGGGEVSLSWGGGEFASETRYDSHFTTPGVVYFAATGDSPGTLYPSVSVNVVAVGGTSVVRSPNSGVLFGQTTWSEGGGGASRYVPAPAYQRTVASLTGATRAVPDIAAIANPYTGVLIYNSYPSDESAPGWQVWGGTSVATPVIAALTNAAGTFLPSSVAQLSRFYGYARSNRFLPITKGLCGPNQGYTTTQPWNACVGLGSPIRPQPF